MGDVLGRRRRAARRSRALRVLPAVLLVLLLTGCRADLSVEIEGTARGAGHVRATVTLDKEAAAQVPDLAQQLRVDDLEAAGWTVDGPSPAPGEAGGVTLRVTKPFTTPEGAARAIEELSGAGGPFSTLRLTRERGFWKTKTSLTGTVDLTAGLGAFGDAALTETLGAPNLGLDPAAVERELGKPLAEAVHVELIGRLPGTVTSNAPSSRDGAGAWPVVLGATSAVTSSSEAWNVLTLAFAGLAAVSGLALLVVLVRRSRIFSWM
ncbi:MAG: hypothetical protein ACR2MO_06315 [Acidimicrobiales bacterium]